MKAIRSLHDCPLLRRPLPWVPVPHTAERHSRDCQIQQERRTPLASPKRGVSPLLYIHLVSVCTFPPMNSQASPSPPCQKRIYPPPPASAHPRGIVISHRACPAPPYNLPSSAASLYSPQNGRSDLGASPRAVVSTSRAGVCLLSLEERARLLIGVNMRLQASHMLTRAARTKRAPPCSP